MTKHVTRLTIICMLFINLPFITFAAWYDTDYNYKRHIQIESSKLVGTSHSNFPVLLTESNFDSTFFTHVEKSDVNNMDIIFVDSSETTELDREVVVYNQGSETLEVWVKLNPATPTTDFYVYYGYASANKPNSTNTWSNAYAGVWHMQQIPTGSSDDIIESTSNGEHGTSQNMDATNFVTGPLHGALEFDDSYTQYLDCGSSNNLKIEDQLTLSGWIKLVSPDNNHRIAISKKGNWDDNNGYELEFHHDNDHINLIGHGSDFARTDTANHDGDWHYFVAVADGTVAAIYKDGQSQTLVDAVLGAITNSNQDLNIGRRSGDGNYFYGQLDEIRIQDTNRTADWISTEYNNQSDPATFFSIASEESQTTPTVSPTHTTTITPGDTPTSTPTPIPTNTPTPSITATYTISATSTFMPTLTHSATTTLTSTVTATRTATITTTVTTTPTANLPANNLANVITYPNPHRGDKNLKSEITFFNLPEQAEITIYDLNGKLVRNLRKIRSGNRLTWYMKNNNGAKISSGIYLYIIKSASEEKRGKIIILK